jgi:hypothetical protein
VDVDIRIEDTTHDFILIKSHFKDDSSKSVGHATTFEPGEQFEDHDHGAGNVSREDVVKRWKRRDFSGD